MDMGRLTVNQIFRRPLTIRGPGASCGLANDGLEQGVGVYIGQVYNSRPTFVTTDFVDIKQVEVLRGPPGTLFGKNTTAGALNVTTRDASNSFEAAVEGTVGSDNYRQAKARISGPLIKDGLAARLSFVGTWRYGNLYNPVQKLDQNAVDSQRVRGQLPFTPNARRLQVGHRLGSRGRGQECPQRDVHPEPHGGVGQFGSRRRHAGR